MARSYKKEPVYKGTTRGMKRVANKKVRRINSSLDVGSHNWYRRVFSSYDIADVQCRQTLEGALHFKARLHETYNRSGQPLEVVLAEAEQDWYKTFRRK